MQWDGLSEALSIESLRPVHEVNAHCVEYLVAAARGDPAASSELVARLGELLRGLNGAARRRAAEQQFLLVDFRFRSAEWWQWARNATATAGDGAGRPAELTRESAVALARATLMLAWHSVRANRVAALVLWGVSPDAAAVLATLRLADIDRIAEAQCQHARPRWEDRPAVWRRLLLAARDDDAASMRDVTLHWLQLLAGELIPVAVSGPVAERGPLHSRAPLRRR